MKAAVSSYSFYGALKSGRLGLYDIPGKVAELGFDAMEFAFLPHSEDETTAECAKRLREQCDKAGLSVLAYAISADFINGSGGNWEKEAERLQGELEIARILGAPKMRHDTTSGYKPGYAGVDKSFEGALEAVVNGTRRVAEMAQQMGIETMSENHGYFAQDAARVEKIICGVNHPNYGALVDIGNFVCADEDCYSSVGLLAPYAKHVHAKDFLIKSGNGVNPGEGWFPSRGGQFLRGTIIGHGEVPVLQCLRILKRAGYDGYVSIEFEGLEDPIEAVRIGKANLERYFELI